MNKSSADPSILNAYFWLFTHCVYQSKFRKAVRSALFEILPLARRRPHLLLRQLPRRPSAFFTNEKSPGGKLRGFLKSKLDYFVITQSKLFGVPPVFVIASLKVGNAVFTFVCVTLDPSAGVLNVPSVTFPLDTGCSTLTATI